MREKKLTTREAEQHTGIPEASLLWAAKATPPRLRSYKLGPRGPYLFDRVDLDEFLAAADNMSESRTR